MSGPIFIFINLISLMAASYIDDETFMKPKVEKNNIVNKGVWIKRSDDDQPTKMVSGDFIFRSSSLDADSLLHNNFDPFGETFGRDSMMVPNYIERTKRSTNDKNIPPEGQRSKNTTNQLKFRNRNVEKPGLVKSKLLKKIKPDILFNDYPYEVAIMLSNGNTSDQERLKGVSPKDIYNTYPLNFTKSAPNLVPNIDNLVKTQVSALKSENSNGTNATDIIPKRSMQHEYESEIIKKIELTEEVNKTEESLESNKMDRNVFETEDRAWHQAAPLPDVNTFKILPKTEDNRKINRPITEKGLVKVLSMLTKTFKKVMKQHNDIKKIQTKVSSTNNEFMKNAQLLMSKFQDFDIKYVYLMKFNENIKDLEARLRGKEEFYNAKEVELTKNLAQFEKQQKKFLLQQQQFYNIQKLMLAQNEKINLKQNLIAKTQNEISLRQNNFARILKKAKQIYIDTKNPIPQKLSAILSKPKESTEVRTTEMERITSAITTETPNTESIKIDLLSVPAVSRIMNYDNQILKERDDHSVDDLIYKYYFNNTYIDVLMKNKILASFATASGNPLTRNAKNKRNENLLFDKSTNIIALNNFNTRMNQIGKSSVYLNRGKRWIKYSNKNAKRKHLGKDYNVTLKRYDLKPNPNKSKVSYGNTVSRTIKYGQDKKAIKDPFWVMATSFCKGIGQDDDEQMLHWCIEKALRRLRSIEKNLPQVTNMSEPTEIIKTTNGVTRDETVQQSQTVTQAQIVSDTTSTTHASSGLNSMVTLPVSVIIEDTTDSSLFFPDNDQLESNLKQYEMKPDTDGTVYYDGSVHASQCDGPESDGISDLLPGAESDSRVDVDPLTLDLQQKRRAYVRRINADIMRRMKSG